MIAVILEATARSAVLFALIELAILAARPRNPHVHKLLWSTVAVASLAMPGLLAFRIVPVIHASVPSLTVLPRLAPSDAFVPRTSAADLLYLVPVLLLLLRYLSGWIRMRGICHDASRCREPWAGSLDVRVSPRVSTPVTFGTTIVLPADVADWPERKLRGVIAHERAHVLNRDCWMLWLARFNAACFWFNPLAWWLVRRLGALMEQTSDEAAIAALEDHTGYAEIVLALGSSRASPVATAMATSTLSRRIEHILAGTAPAVALKRAHRIAVLAFLLPAVAAAAAPIQLEALGATAKGMTAAPPRVTAAAQPRIVGWGSLGAYYPKKAKRLGLRGLVDVAVMLDPEGRPLRARVVSEEPAGHGFGDAAATAAVQTISYSNPIGRRVTLVFRVKFALTAGASRPK